VLLWREQVRLGTYINAPPAACVAARAAQEDPRAEPAFGERVPYVVVCGAPSEQPGTAHCRSAWHVV
jgi:DNA polymerase zeta